MAPSSPRKYSIPRLLALGVAFHLIYIASVFDCYFTSPIVHGMKPHRVPLARAPAKRLVLIVGDGLRADFLFHTNATSLVPDPTVPERVAPFLRDVVERRGAWGVSHTRVPTESRPGHVAVIGKFFFGFGFWFVRGWWRDVERGVGVEREREVVCGEVEMEGGMYEDVSAVTKGWKTNPVTFDSLFNQSSHTFSFGSPDILPMFAHGATPGKVRTWCYDERDEDFTKAPAPSSELNVSINLELTTSLPSLPLPSPPLPPPHPKSDATSLDLWVLSQLRTLLQNATTDARLDRELRADGVVFFLHLLGLDTTGHAWRPFSKEYMNNIRVVDSIVRQTEELLEEFYAADDFEGEYTAAKGKGAGKGKSRTSYIFTADHGMSVIGNHGDGDPDNTRTPLIAWGAGVRGPIHLPSHSTSQVPHANEVDEYSAPWALSHLHRQDVEQADIAALMSALLGVPWPVNSVGVLPEVRRGVLESRLGDATSGGVGEGVGEGVGGYLDLGEAGLAGVGWTNAKVILEHYRVKHELKRSHVLFYKPYKPLSSPSFPPPSPLSPSSSPPSSSSSSQPGEPHLLEIERLIEAGEFMQSRRKSAELIELALEGIRYLETYDRTLIRTMVSFAYTGWMAFAALFILAPRGSSSSSSTPSRSPVAATTTTRSSKAEPSSTDLSISPQPSSTTSISPEPSSTPISTSTLLSSAVLTAFWALFAMQKSPWTFYIYVAFPVYFWGCVIGEVWAFSGGRVGGARTAEKEKEGTGKEATRMGGVRGGDVVRWVAGIIGVAVSLQSMVYGYTHREIWSLGFLVIGVLWPLLSWPRTMWTTTTRKRVLGAAWMGACVLTGVFPLLRVDPREGLGAIMSGGICMLLAYLICAIFVLPRTGRPNVETRSLLDFQLVLLLASMAVTASSVRNLRAKRGLPVTNQLSGWIVLATSLLYPPVRFLTGNRTGTHISAECKLLIYFLTFCPLFVLLSIRAEGLFYVCFCVVLGLWVAVEDCLRKDNDGGVGVSGVGESEDGKGVRTTAEREGREGKGKGMREKGEGGRGWNPMGLRGDDVRIAMFFLFFVQVGFFGTGNVASISSFYLEPVYRLVPIFNPFLMASLLILKILAPYVILSAVFATLNARLGMPPFALFLVALTMTDGMTLTFFFNVTDTGSWLEIGQSISYFCITSLLLVFSGGIAAAGRVLMGDSLGLEGEGEGDVVRDDSERRGGEKRTE
ncbi:PigN-domain-containing protein [Stereum hirsutum FP-91666 SS1]|uniref:PigN-domain-containing protein n=1 Tax=Stereum hirsutum (strain FP-91666) TaxID=721885 RepID=UPI00044493E9|nr:PigN-domain-containing protein [Stereum hirsutum FP-91666 SS1]EIM84449.1 PigN-domain-containing protein [Stereum hirsutum FP-91666 SS1]